MSRASASALAGCLLLMLPGCGLFSGSDRPSAGEAPLAVTARDAERLRGWRTAWLAAIEDARARGAAGAVAAEGRLLHPDAGGSAPPPPPGRYRCRLIRLAGLEQPFASPPPVACTIDAEGRFAVSEGEQRPSGRFQADRGGRTLFLGTLALGDETRPHSYGSDATRDMIGLLQRVDDRRWRIALPKPPWGAAFEILEIMPAGA